MLTTLPQKLYKEVEHTISVALDGEEMDHLALFVSRIDQGAGKIFVAICNATALLCKIYRARVCKLQKKLYFATAIAMALQNK